MPINPKNTNVTDLSRTADGVQVEIGLRVQDYNWDWGVVESGPDIGGWYDIRLDNGRQSYMDGTRLSVVGWELEDR